MKRLYVLLVSILFISNLSYAGGPPATGDQIIVHEPVETQVEAGTLTLDRTVTLQAVELGQIYYNGQLQTITQVGNTLYLPDVQKAYTIPDGYDPITLPNETFLYNPDTGSAIDVNWNDAETAIMPTTGGGMMPTTGGGMLPAGPN